MVKETLQLLVTALQHDEYGVNVMLDYVPLLEGETRAPNVRAVLAEVDDKHVAETERPDDWPVLTITAETPSAESGEPMANQAVRDGVVMVAVRYVSGEVDTPKKRRAMYDTLRAAMWTFNRLTTTRVADADLHGVCLLGKNQVFAGGAEVMFEDEPSPLLTGSLLIEWAVRDTEPTGLPS